MVGEEEREKWQGRRGELVKGKVGQGRGSWGRAGEAPSRPVEERNLHCLCRHWGAVPCHLGPSHSGPCEKLLWTESEGCHGEHGGGPQSSASAPSGGS